MPGSIPSLFAGLVDDISLLRHRDAGPGVDEVVEGYLDARDGDHGALVGKLVCPVSRLPALVTELARAAPAEAVDLALVVDSGLGAVPKALSTVFSRPTLLTPRTVETSAPTDLDAVWLERVAEFVPDDVVAVVEPRRPISGDPADTKAWLDAVRRVAEHGCAPKMRCGGPRPSDVPSVEDLYRFVEIAAEVAPHTRRGASVLGLRRIVRVEDAGAGAQHGILNLLVGVARAVHGGDVAAALASTDVDGLAADAGALGVTEIEAVRLVLACCGADPGAGPAALADLGLIA